MIFFLPVIPLIGLIILINRALYWYSWREPTQSYVEINDLKTFYDLYYINPSKWSVEEYTSFDGGVTRRVMYETSPEVHKFPVVGTNKEPAYYYSIESSPQKIHVILPIRAVVFLKKQEEKKMERAQLNRNNSEMTKLLKDVQRDIDKLRGESEEQIKVAKEVTLDVANHQAQH